MLTIPFLGNQAKGILSAYETFPRDKRKTTSQKDVVTWFHLHLSTTKKSRKPQTSYIVATVLCLHKSKEVVLNQPTLRPSHQPALALKVYPCSTRLRKLL